MLHLTPYSLTLRRARHLQVVLFGAFVYFYVTVIWGERLHVLLGFDTPLPLHILGAICGLAGAMVFLGISQRHHFPTMWNSRRLVAFVLATFTICLVTSPNEDAELVRLTSRLNRLGNYEGALAASAHRNHPTVDILAQRAHSLSQMGQLGERFFTYDVPSRLSWADIQAITPDTTLRLLLSRDLDGLAHHLASHPDAKLQRAEREALVLYARLRAKPLLIIHDSTVEQRYLDFCDTRDRLTDYSPVALSNILGETYGDTYWHYFFQVNSADVRATN